MNILVNATSVRLGGGITVIRNLLPAFTSVDEGRHRYAVVCREDVCAALDPKHPRVTLLASEAGSRSALRRLFWEQAGVAARAVRWPADVIFSPAGVAVAASRVPQVLMFQNLAPFDADIVRRSRLGKRIRLNLLRLMGTLSACVADKVVFISDHARSSIAPQIGIDGDRIARVNMGRDERFSPESQAGGAAVRERLGLTMPYVLSVSQFYHYKNFVELVRGFARACRDLPPEVQLVIAGAEHEREYAALVRRTIAEEGIGHRARLLGQVPYEDLPAVYTGAGLFVFPSTCESFPNILIEALSCGVPTLSSKMGPMPELAGDGAIYFDPFDVGEIGARIAELWRDQRTAKAIADRGMAQAERFNWGEAARGLLEVIESVAPAGARRRGSPRVLPATAQETKEYFDLEADSWATRYSQSVFFRERLSTALAWLEREPAGSPILDYGCGSGVLLEHLVGLGHTVIGADNAPAMVEQANRRLRRSFPEAHERFRVELVADDASDLVQRMPEVQGIACLGVLEYVEDPRALIERLAMRVTPGGFFVVSVPNRSSVLRRVERVIYANRKWFRSLPGLRHLTGNRSYLSFQKHQFRSDELDAVMAAAGFSLEQSMFHVAPPWLPAPARNPHIGMTRIAKYRKMT